MDATKVRTMNQIDTIIKGFEGEILHPSLDMKSDVLVLGFRQRVTLKKEKNLYIIIAGNTLSHTYKPTLTHNNKTYHIDLGQRKLVRLSEVWGLPELNQILASYKAGGIASLSIDVNRLFNDARDCIG